jgi:hypothetical protein
MVYGVRRTLFSFSRQCDDRRTPMDLIPTLAITGAFLGLAVGAGWLGARPPNPHRGPRLMPWRFIMMLAAAGILIMLVHLVNLLGVNTGR